MAESEYWFARRFPVGHPKNSMSPINEQGWGVVRGFLAWMVGGAIAAAVLTLLGLFVVPWLWVLAPVVFAACAAYAGWTFIRAATVRGDHNHTVEDYKAGRVS